MQITEIRDQPATLKPVTGDTRGKDPKVYTANFAVVFYFHNILKVLSPTDNWELPDLWDDEQRPVIKGMFVSIPREFENYGIAFKRNAATLLTFQAEKLHGFKLLPKEGEILEVTMKVLGVCSEGDIEQLHKLVKDESITISIQNATGSQGDL